MKPASGERLILVTGCPRSGTRTMSAMLQEAGLQVPHENTGPDGSVSCFFAVDDYFYGPRHRDGRLSDFQFKHRFHQVRHPLKAIQSMTAMTSKKWFWHWQEKHTRISLDHPSPAREAAFWLTWNNFIEDSKPDLRYQIEDIPWDVISDRLGLDVPKPNTANRGVVEREPLQWSDLGSLELPIRRRAEKYGYE